MGLFGDKGNAARLDRLSASVPVLFVAYYLCALVGNALAYPPDFISPISPANALLLAVLIVSPMRLWWLVFATIIPAGFLANFSGGIEWYRLGAVITSDFLGSCLAVYVLNYLGALPPDFDSPISLARYSWACILVPMIEAFPGAFVSTFHTLDPFWTIWRDWFISDALSYILISPLFLLAAGGTFQIPEKRSRTGYVLEAMVLALGFALVMNYMMNPTPFGRAVVPAVLYLPLPLLVWTAVRFGPTGTYAAVVSFSICAMWSATAGYGIFAVGVPQKNILSMQLYLLLSLTPIVFLASAVRSVKAHAESERKVERRFHSLFEDVPIGLWVEDLSQVKVALDELERAGIEDLESYLARRPDEVARLAGLMRVTDVNQATLNLLGAKSKEELLANTHRVFTAESIDGISRMLVQLKTSAAAARSEGVNHSLDGRRLWVDVHAHAMPGAEGDWSQIMLSTSDLTERKIAEQALLESDNRHRDILGAMTDALIITDVDGYIESWNRAATMLYGFSGVELERTHFTDLMTEAERSKFEELKKALAKGEKFACESHDRHKGGTTFHTELHATSIHFGAKPHMLLLIRDITERKNAEDVRAGLEEQLRRAQKLEAIGTLAGGVAHDFNNLLAAMMGYAELTLLKLDKDSPQYEYVMRILGAGERAKQVVLQILSFSRQTEVEKQPVDLRPLFKETMRLLRATIPTTIEIVEDFSDEELVVLADPTRMHQVLMNLATNAYHAMLERGGRLEVSLARKCGDGNFMEFRVSDTGHGIPGDILQRIFDPYFTTKGVGQGSGMGLAVVQGIIAEHNGQIEVESALSAGTTFRISLPLVDETPVSAVSKDSDLVGLTPGSERVMVVDDEPAIVELIQIALSQFGYRVSVFTSPKKALNAFLADPNGYDVVVSDQTMPEMTGSEMAKRMLSVRKDLPVIVCTGHSELINSETAHSFGIKSFFMKPVKTSELAKAIRRLMAH